MLINCAILGSDYDLSPVLCQAINWTNLGLLSIGSLGTIFKEIRIKIWRFLFKKICLKILSVKLQPFCFGLNLLFNYGQMMQQVICRQLISGIIGSDNSLLSKPLTECMLTYQLIRPKFDGLVQDCSNSSALAMELLQSCTKPSKWIFHPSLNELISGQKLHV